MSNAFTEEDLERCTLSSHREILFQLRTLVRQKDRVSVIFDDGRQSFLTVLVGVSEEKNCLYFDIGGSEETNTAFLKSERCQFTGIVGGIRIQFSTKHPRIVSYEGSPAFSIDIPRSLLRLQRREAYRLQLPTAKPYICRVRRRTPEEMSFPLYDISIGGLGIQVIEKPAFDPMVHLDNTLLDLREAGVITVTLEVRYIMATESRARKPIWHMGCRFLDLPPVNETLIQRFMARIEAERRALAAE